MQLHDGGHQALVSFFCRFQCFVRKVKRTTVVSLKDKETHGHGRVGLFQNGIISGKELIQGNEIAEWFTHFLSVDRYHIVMHPVSHGRMSLRGSALRDLALVMRELQVKTAPVNVKRVAKVFLAHAGTFQMPPREAHSPRGRPAHNMFGSRFFP